MIRLVFFFLIVGAIAIGAAWLADRPGEILLTWQGYRIQTSLMAAGMMVLLLVGFIFIVLVGLRLVLGTPGTFRGFMRSRRRARGYHALSRGMIAVGAGDARLAQRYAQQARKILEDEPLTLLLTAQTAQLKGDRDTARHTFEAMLESAETETLGLRGLFIEAQRRGDGVAARGFAERALKISEATPWAGEALFEMQAAASDWAGALATLARNQTNRITPKDEARRLRAVLLTAQALETDRAQSDHALTLALEAHQLSPGLVPAAVVAGRLLTKTGNVRRASKVLEKTWALQPHPDIADAYMEARSGDTARDKLKRMRSLAARTPQNRDAALALAAAAIDARQWNEARQTLEPFTRGEISQKVCSLMAEIEDAQSGDTGKVREWLARAVKAPRDPMWIADGVGSPVWAAISPVTGRIDAFEWKSPAQTTTAKDALALPEAGPSDAPVQLPAVAVDAQDTAETDMAAEPELVIDEAETIDIEPSGDDSPEDDAAVAAGPDKAADVVAEVEDAAPAVRPDDKAATGAATQAKAKIPPQPVITDGLEEPESADRELGFNLRPPDDPGPDGDPFDEDAREARTLN